MSQLIKVHYYSNHYIYYLKICGFQNLKILFSDLLDQIALIFV